MKKVLIGILILIPVIILGIVTLVGSIASVAAHIGVESVTIQFNEGVEDKGGLDIVLSDVSDKVISAKDYLDVEVLPTKATNPSLEWEILDLQILDKEYEALYESYLSNPDENMPVLPPVMLVDSNGNETSKNSTGQMKISTYCVFTLKVMAEQQSDQIIVSVVGYDVEKLMLSMKKEFLYVGESAVIETAFTPVDSIVEKIEWKSSDTDIVTVDKNGIIRARKDGKAAITCTAYKFTDPDKFVESTFNVVVKKAASILGNEVYLHTPTITLEELGIYAVRNITGGSVAGNIIRIESDIVEIETSNGTVTIHKCEENDIKINEYETLAADRGFVLAVSGLPIELSASYVSSLKDETINPVWASSDETIATISENGVLRTLQSGLVKITASYGGKTAEIELNIQNKISALVLVNSDNFYKVGLAQETVFASHVYKNVASDNTKLQNSMEVIIKGEPKNATDEERRAFYNAFVFEIKEGSDFAEFDETDPNKLLFLDALEGAGKQTIKVRVTAKYPRYSSFDSYTTAYLNVNAVYGVAVGTCDELIQAAKDQEAYATDPDNIIVTTDNPKVSYAFTNGVGSCREARVSSKKAMAICVTNNIKMNTDLDFGDVKNVPGFFGSVYGNNHMLSAEREQYEDDADAMLNIEWSDVTISNLIVRADELNGMEEITTGEDTAALRGQCIDIGMRGDRTARLQNVNIEYTILENARCCSSIDASEVTYKGCIVRNMSSVGMYAFYTIRGNDNNRYMLQCDITVENMIFSNCLGTAFDLDTCCFEVKYENEVHTNDKYNFGETKEESDAFIKENIVKLGLNGSFTQKGFLDIYNWQSTENVSFIKTGDDSLDDIIQIATSSILGTDPGLESFRYRYKNVDYFHLGFMVDSLDQSNFGNAMTMNEQVWMDIKMQDERFVPFHMYDVKDATFGQLLSKFGITIYGYNNQSDLKPSSSYVINGKLIDKLHGNY